MRGERLWEGRCEIGHELNQSSSPGGLAEPDRLYGPQAASRVPQRGRSGRRGPWRGASVAAARAQQRHAKPLAHAHSEAPATNPLPSREFIRAAAGDPEMLIAPPRDDALAPTEYDVFAEGARLI